MTSADIIAGDGIEHTVGIGGTFAMFSTSVDVYNRENLLQLLLSSDESTYMKNYNTCIHCQ